MVLAAFRPCSFLAVSVAIFAALSPSFLASAVHWNTTTCEELASLPSGHLTEDSTLWIRDPVLTCDEVGTACDILYMLGGCLACLCNGMHSPLIKFGMCWIGCGVNAATIFPVSWVQVAMGCGFLGYLRFFLSERVFAGYVICDWYYMW